MTKEGRPSRINDIRYLHGNIHKYREGIEDAMAFGRRLAWFLNGENFSLGAYPSLYISFTPTLEPGAVQVTDYGGDWWQRYTHVGVSHDFPNTLEGSERIITGTIAALAAIRPDLETTIASAEQTVRIHGDKLRFLLKSRQTKHFNVDISFNISRFGRSHRVFLFRLLTYPAVRFLRRRHFQSDFMPMRSILRVESRSPVLRRPYCRTDQWVPR